MEVMKLPALIEVTVRLWHHLAHSLRKFISLNAMVQKETKSTEADKLVNILSSSNHSAKGHCSSLIRARSTAFQINVVRAALYSIAFVAHHDPVIGRNVARLSNSHEESMFATPSSPRPARTANNGQLI